MSLDPHVVRTLDRDSHFYGKSTVVGVVCCVLHVGSTNRQMMLGPHPSRAIPRYAINELILTDDAEAGLGKVVNHVAYIGFFEATRGGMILVGDRVEIDGRELGTVVGFDETHFPNHMNVCVRAPAPLRTGFEMGVQVGARVSFTFVGPDQAKTVAK